MRRLHNRDWGFETNCFVCEPSNDQGLRIPFFVDGDRVVARFSLDDEFSGAPKYVHGGVVLAVLDEAMAWASIAIAGKVAVTKQTSTEFARPVRVGLEQEVEAFAEAVDATIATRALLRDDRGNLCASAHATFVPLGPAQLHDATGAEPSATITQMLADER